MTFVPVSALISLNDELLMSKCKEHKHFYLQVSFGHGILTATEILITLQNMAARPQTEIPHTYIKNNNREK